MSAEASGPEFALLVQCCRCNFAKVEQTSPAEIGRDLDWSLFVALARHHRVQGLAWNALAQHADVLPDQARQALSSDARSIAATNLGIAAECREIQLGFERAEVPLLFVKGLAVGALAYRSPMLKMGWDIDLLVDPHDLEQVAELLARRGYRLREPSSRARLHQWHGWSKESLWSREGSFHIELHTRLADNVKLIPKINVHSARQNVAVTPQTSLPTLANEELFAYLAVHGASSAWFRLKWISDFVALLEGRSGHEIERLYRRSQELGSGRAAGQALMLADKLFDTLRTVPELRSELAIDRVTRRLYRTALRMLAKADEPTERPLGTLAIHTTQLLLKPGLGYKFSEFWRQASAMIRR